MIALIVRLIMFVTLFAFAFISTEAGAHGGGEARVAELNSAETAQGAFSELIKRAGLGWDYHDSNRKIDPRIAVAFTEYLMRTAPTAKPDSGGEGVRELGYNDTQAMGKSILAMEDGPARDRAATFAA